MTTPLSLETIKRAPKALLHDHLDGGLRPATVIDEIRIDLPRPRSIAMTEEDSFNRYVRHLRKSIEASHEG